MNKAYYAITKYLLMFFLSSFIGWVYEIICVYVLFHCYMDRGVLHIPCCPIYGFGLLILYFIFRKVKNPFVVFGGSVAITTTVEYLTYVFVEYKYHVILWTYEGWPLNYKGRVSAISSIIFGLLAVSFLKLAVPVIERIYGSKAKKAVSLFVTALFFFCVGWESTFLI